MEIEGVISPVVTPVNGRDGGVDADALTDLARAQLDAGIDGLFPCGTTGEFASLSRDERRTVVETVVDAAGDAPVLAGCGATSVDRVLTYAGDAADAGADVAVVVTPYYADASQDGLRAFYEAVADDAPLPVMLYDIPANTGQRLEPDTVADLAEHPDIVGLKDSGPELGHFYRLVRATPDSFALFEGVTANALSSLDAGADGIVSGAANPLPAEIAALYDAHAAGDRERTTEILRDVLVPWADLMDSLPPNPMTKHLTGAAGHDVGPPLPPLSELDDEQRETAEERYREITDAFEE